MHSNSAYIKAKKIADDFSFVKKNILSPKAFSLPYILYRLSRPILKGYYKQFKYRHKETPWTTPASIKIFDELLTKEMVGFEYGSGKSTLFFSKKLKSLVSVEHNKEWYNLVSDHLKERSITHVDYQFIPADDHLSINKIEFHQKFNLKEGELKIMHRYYHYFQFIRKYPEAYFDFIIVDGRARVECSLNAIDKLKPGGMLVLDNSERRRYKPVHKVLKNWQKVYTTNGLTDTTIWFKPDLWAL